MVSSYDDDEAVQGDEIIDDDDEDEPEFGGYGVNEVKATTFNQMAAPTESSLFKVQIQLMPASRKRFSLPQDIVILLDASSSMAKDDRLERVKALANNVIHRLNQKDRLSVIVYEGEVYRLCKLQLITLLRKRSIQHLINELVAGGGSNLEAGLREAMKVLDGRKFTKGRRCAILLMSDGDSHHGYSSVIQTYNVPIHVIYYGHQLEYQAIFQKIASSSNGGTVTFVNPEDKETSDNFNRAISNFVAVQLRIVLVVRNLRITINEVESKLDKVYPENFPQCWDGSSGSVTISLGDLHHREKLSVMLDVLLDAVQEQCGTDVLEFTYCWESDIDGCGYEAPPMIVTIFRKPMPNTYRDLSRDEEANDLDNMNSFDKNNQFQHNTTNLEDDLDKLNLLIALSELPLEYRRLVTKDLVNKLRMVASTSMSQFPHQM